MACFVVVVVVVVLLCCRVVLLLRCLRCSFVWDWLNPTRECVQLVKSECVCVHPDSTLRVLVRTCWLFSFSRARGQRRPIELCPTELSMVISGYWD